MTEPLEGDTGIVATVTTAITTIHIAFPITTSSGFIIQTAFKSSGEKWTLEEAHLHAEKYEAARGIGQGGYKCNIGGSMSGSFNLGIEKKPNSAIKMIADLTYIRERST